MAYPHLFSPAHNGHLTSNVGCTYRSSLAHIGLLMSNEACQHHGTLPSCTLRSHTHQSADVRRDLVTSHVACTLFLADIGVPTLMYVFCIRQTSELHAATLIGV